MAILKKSPLEKFIASYVKQKSRFRSTPMVYVDKAIVLIAEKIDPTCCEGVGPVDLQTFRDNLLTRSVRMYLNGMPKTAANVESLQRTSVLLEEFKRSSCCPDEQA